MLNLLESHFREVVEHANESLPAECCGFVGGVESRSTNIYRFRNVAANPGTRYEAEPADLFQAQRAMRERGEELLAIYHSHPRQIHPTPSETDVRLAYYPQAIYLIIGLAGAGPELGAFRISAESASWETAEIHILAASPGRT